MTFNVMVFDTAFPFLGLTVTVTLQEPAFRPFREAPNTLQNLAELGTTLRDTFEVERTLSFANAAIDFAATAFDVFIVTTVAVTGELLVMAAIGTEVVDIPFEAVDGSEGRTGLTAPAVGTVVGAGIGTT